ncbi:bifunctional UDP-N-acetylglucosamine diphosphorylase/glucosamine-1-phosphate N-acetyltransferase GlmU [Deinococcus maricopensis]|uniref:Bifunctional protein GlmU n=1 Tax=Deinococcus maricopensis (strain DSM 21211 / LMG 22137 / NRRL B-23946 / LB-34) TaxID=709986 RepID=E8U701_DEIML|nr:bifunctional UDP-N-acetylglucosamine diphosphorylase/glucosamine-1-phosphate N-acetyltransferase GlmU [Deinococcus maricopensis]ADV66840.1 Bifunctional protein glmU [Deinococcus maricopensis DSM 21211]
MTEPQPSTRRVPLDVVILAAGQGTRMRSKLPKMLHPVAGRPMVGWSVNAAKTLGARDIIVVTGHGADQIETALAPEGVRFVRQDRQLGTGHAFLVAARALQGGADVLLLYGDTPMLPPETLARMLEQHRTHGSALTVLTSELPDATGYGRIIRDENGEVARIVEEKAANPEEKRVREFNSGVYVMDDRAPALAERITDDNPAGEYYITDLIALYRGEGAPVQAFRIPDAGEVMGANDRAQLAVLERLMRERINARHMRDGVTITDPASTYIEDTVRIARDATIQPGVILRGRTVIGEDAVIGAYSVIEDSEIGAGAVIKPHSMLEGAVVGSGSDVGPFARLRAGANLAGGVHIGNFVEVKNATLHEGVKAGHLAYLGDVTIGAETNVGAGTIIANFDGVNKHRTDIGAGVFIGSNSTLIAPRAVGDAAFIAAGSTVHEDVPEGALAVARGKQRTVTGWSRRYWNGVRAQVERKLPWLAGWLARQSE